MNRNMTFIQSMVAKPIVGLGLVAACTGLFSASTALAGTIYTWTGNNNDGLLNSANNWSPSGTPAGGNGDTIQWNGTQGGTYCCRTICPIVLCPG